jgi:hypothetical protein
VLTKEIVNFQPDFAIFQRQRYLNVDPNVCVPYVVTILTNMQNCCNINKKTQPFAGEIYNYVTEVGV